MADRGSMQASERKKARGFFSGYGMGFFALALVLGLAWALSEDHIILEELPDRFGFNGLGFGMAVALLIVTVNVLLPICHGLARHLGISLAVSKKLREEGGTLRLIWELILWLPRQLFYRIFWVLRLASYLLALALIAASILFVVRTFKADALEEQLKLHERAPILVEEIKDLRSRFTS